MRLTERSYSGKYFRPRPEFLINQNLGVIATPWGPRSTAKRAIQAFTDYFHAAQDDQEATSAFQLIESLSPLANQLRVALMMTNDTLLNEENKDHYNSGVELFAFSKTQNELAFVQVGGGSFFIDRQGFDLQPLSVQLDLSAGFSHKNQILNPLPSTLVGLGQTIHIQSQSINTQNGDRFILLQRSFIPARFLAVAQTQRNLSHFSRVLAHHSEDFPFWLGLLEL